MPNGLGAILAALAGGAKGYTNLKQREREEALEAERRAREEQDRQEQKAFQQFEMERELRKMGGRYTDEMGPGTLNPDPPSLVKMDRVEAALLGTANALPPRADGTPRGPLKIGLTPNAANIGIDLDKERVRMASQAIEVPGSGGKRVYLPTTDELDNRKFQREAKEGAQQQAVATQNAATLRKTLATEASAAEEAELANAESLAESAKLNTLVGRKARVRLAVKYPDLYRVTFPTPKAGPDREGMILETVMKFAKTLDENGDLPNQDAIYKYYDQVKGLVTGKRPAQDNTYYNMYKGLNDPSRNPVTMFQRPAVPVQGARTPTPVSPKEQIDAEQYKALIDAGYSPAEIAVQYTVKR